MNAIEHLETQIRKAGDLLMEYFPAGGGLEPLAVNSKTDNSPVTQADLASNELLIAALSELFPGDGIFSEETPADPEIFTRERVWIIDPLDGTRSFINGQDDFSILVGLSEKNVMTYGVMFFPALGLFCRARLGEGATANGEKLTVSSGELSGDSSVYVRNTELVHSQYRCSDSMDSGYACYSLASGTIEGLVIKLTHHREWDYAAPSLIIQEAGGVMTDEYGAPLSFATGNQSARYICASHPDRHARLLQEIAS